MKTPLEFKTFLTVFRPQEKVIEARLRLVKYVADVNAGKCFEIHSHESCS